MQQSVYSYKSSRQLLKQCIYMNTPPSIQLVPVAELVSFECVGHAS